MAEEALQLDEIIVTGTPGGTQRRAIGNVVTTIDVSDIVQDVAVSTFQDLLTARSTGIQFTRVTANVGASSGIKIRGVGSFTLDTQPLIYVDGLRVNNDDEAGPVGSFGNQVSVLDDFNPQDIESIEIIKGPAAASLYGTEASAGVIQIITKRGAAGAPQFNVTIRQGTNFITNPQAKIGPQYGCSLTSGSHSAGCRDIDSPNLFLYNMYDEANRYIREGYYPWETPEIFQNGHTQSYNVDVSGGTDALRYFISANYENEEGVVYYNTDETFRLRGNISVVFGGDFSLDVSTGYVDGFTRFANPGFLQGGVWTDLVGSTGYWLDRITPFGFTVPAGGEVFDNGNPRLGGFYNHLPSDIADIQALRDYSRFTGSATFRHNYGDWLNQRLVVGLDKAWDINTNLYPKEDGPIPESVSGLGLTEWSSVFAQTKNGELTFSRPSEDNFTFDYNITADYDYNDAFSFATSFGAQYYVETRERFSDQGQGFASPLSRTINQLSVYAPPTYELTTNKSLGFYIQERVSWNDRLFLTASMRFDDNSTFGVDAPARRYPNVSGAWVVSEESFWNVDWVNSLRLRGAWGKAGRQPSATAGINTFQVIVGPTGAPAIRADSPGNPEIEPEVSTETEVGFEVAVFDDRVSADFTYYKRIDRNALLSLDLLPSSGFPGSVQQNLGRIDNWGWEARLSMRIYDGDAWQFDLDLGADHTMNEIKKLGDTPGDPVAGRQIGLPFPNHYIVNRVTDAEFGSGLGTPIFINSFFEFISAECDSGVSLAPQAVQDRAADNTLSDPDKQAAAFELNQYGLLEGGEPKPCAYAATFLNAGPAFATYTFTVAPRISLLNNNLQIFALAEGQYGRINRDDLTDWGHHRFHNSLAARFETDPVFVVEETLAFGGNTWAKVLYDADFWRIREAGARYNFSPELAEKIGAGRASIAFSVRNLWTPYRAQTTISGGTIADPELGRNSDAGEGNYWVMPPSASMNLTLRVSF